MNKKILYIKAQGLGDMIGGLPFLVEQKKIWNTVYQTFYDMIHINKWVNKLSKEQQEKYKKYPMYGWWHHILKMIQEQWLIKDIVIIPHGLRNLILFFFRNFRKYDEAVIPIKTKAAQLLWWILAKKSRTIFNDTNDTSHYRILADGEHQGKCPALHEYNQYFSLPQEKVELPDHFIAIFPSIYERSLEMKDWIDILHHCRDKWYQVIIVWWEREQWFIHELKKHNAYDGIIDYMAKTSLWQMAYILAHAKVCISGNGWPMRIANLVNAYCINIHTTSAYLMEPPVDNKKSFNIRPYHYNSCKPCECADSTIWLKWISWCVFYNTTREGECRKFMTAKLIIKYIDLILIKK